MISSPPDFRRNQSGAAATTLPPSVRRLPSALPDSAAAVGDGLMPAGAAIAFSSKLLSRVASASAQPATKSDALANNSKVCLARLVLL